MVAASLIATIAEENMSVESDIELDEEHETGEMAEMNQYLNGQLPLARLLQS